MGIKGLVPFLKKKGCLPESIPLKNMNGFTIAIDTPGLLYKYKYVSVKEELELTNVIFDEVDEDKVNERIWQFISSFCDILSNHNISPIFVFDGEQTEVKKKCKEKRRKERQKKIDKAEELLSKIRDCLEDPFIDYSSLLDEYKKLQASSISIKDKEINFIRDSLKGSGLTTLKAYGEAEKLCVELEKGKIASAVYSQDTDCLAMGCKKMIRKIEKSFDTNGFPVYMTECFKLKNILPKLGENFTFDMFQDLCIMCGCDFNDNVFRVGPKRSFDLLVKHGNIDKIIIKEKKKDFSILNYVDCKKIFNVESLTNMEDVLLKFSFNA
jgi:flap endonuclease-1